MAQNDASAADAQPKFARATIAAHTLAAIDPQTRGVVPPLHLATTFIRDADNRYTSGYVYGRPDNATVREAEAVINALEGGAEAMVLGSGMSAAVACFLSLQPGDHVLAPAVMYWALRNWLMTDARAFGIEAELVAMDDLAAVARALRPGKTKLVWLETPANPLWTLTDIAAVSALAHAAGARVAVDSTAATPILSRPLEHGADIVMHSATKYLNGHSDVIAGALVCARPDDAWARIKRVRAMQGMILGPFEAFLLLRGLRTLDVRVRAACRNAMALATRLANHAAVADVLYPGLDSHPGHAIAARQMEGGFGGMLSIRLRSGEAGAIAAAAHVKLWKRATSLGGVESLIEHRASIEGAGSPCPPDLLRLSAGIEDIDDLYRDLDAAMTAVV